MNGGPSFSSLLSTDSVSVRRNGKRALLPAPSLLASVGNTINVGAMGARGVISQDATSLLREAFLLGIETQRRVLIPPGTYLVSLIDMVLTDDLLIEMQPGASIVGAPDIAAPVLQFDSHKVSGVDSDVPQFVLLNGRIDNSLRTFVPSEQSGTALSVKRLSRLYVNNVEFYAGEDFSTDGGDSGITAQQCLNVVIENSRFIGQPDLGIYLSGSGVTDSELDSNSAVIVGNFFRQCSGAVSSKRLYRRTLFQSNVVQECRVGFSLFEAAVGADTIAPGVDCIVAGNIFKKIETRAIDLRCLPHGSVVSGNVVRDWGVYLNGVSAGTASDIQYAVRLLGCQGVNMFGNDLALDAWSKSGQIAIDLPDFAIGETAYQSKNNFIHGNKIAGTAYGIRSSGTGPNCCVMNAMTGVDTPYNVSDSSLILCTDDNGFAVGRTSSTTLNADGVGLTIGGAVIGVRSNAPPGVFVRKDGFGATINVYHKGVDDEQPVLIGSISSNVGGLKISSETNILLSTLPTASDGLPAGTLWNSAGTVKIV